MLTPITNKKTRFFVKNLTRKFFFFFQEWRKSKLDLSMLHKNIGGNTQFYKKKDLSNFTKLKGKSLNYAETCLFSKSSLSISLCCNFCSFSCTRLENDVFILYV